MVFFNIFGIHWNLASGIFNYFDILRRVFVIQEVVDHILVYGVYTNFGIFIGDGK